MSTAYPLRRRRRTQSEILRAEATRKAALPSVAKSRTKMYLRIKPDELNHRVSKLDTTYWASTVNNSTGIQAALPRRADKVIGADIFQALYDWNPELRKDGPDLALTAWLKKTASTEVFQELRATTVGSRDVAAGATSAMYREMMRTKDSMLKTVAATKDSLDQMNMMMVEGPIADRARDAIALAQGELAKAIENEPVKWSGDNPLSGKTLNPLGTDADSMQEAITKAIGVVQLATDLVPFDSQEGRGGSEAKILGMLDSQLMQRVTDNDNLRKIFQLAGRMRVVLQQAKSKQPRPAPTPVGLTLGGDISNTLSSELATLSNPDTEDIFYQKYLEKSLIQYDHKARVNEGLGPFICLLDVSGSMRGQKMETAKALFVSLARMGIEKKRKLALIPFASQAGKPMEIDSASSLSSMLTREFNVGSGTQFTYALDEAYEYILVADPFKKADVLLITDGQCTMQDEWIEQYMEKKKKLGFRLYGLNMEQSTWQVNQLLMYDATAHIDSTGHMTSLDWMHELADAMVR